MVDFEAAEKFRSHQYVPIPLDQIDHSQILEVAHIIANSFAVNEPMNRHVQPPREIPQQLIDRSHQDVFGNDAFGAWTKENILFWFIRLTQITDPSHPKGAIGMNDDLLRHSLVTLDDDLNPIGGSFNATLPHKETVWRKHDPFLEATFLYQNPIIDFIHHHENMAIQALNEIYPHFRIAHQSGKVGYIVMIARSEALPTEHTFELFAASFKNFQERGYEYMLITASNQWTGAACELLGAARIYFAPFREMKRVAVEVDAGQNEPFSTDGFISYKQSGFMIYAVKL